MERHCADDRGNCGFRQSVVNLETSGALIGWRERERSSKALHFSGAVLCAEGAVWHGERLGLERKPSSTMRMEQSCHQSPADALRVRAPCGPSRGGPGLARLRTCVKRCKSCSSCCICFFFNENRIIISALFQLQWQMV